MFVFESATLTRLLIGILFHGVGVFATSDSALAWQDKSDSKTQQQERRRQRSNQDGRQQLGQQDDAPQVGDVATVFTLKSLDGESETDIASFQGQKPIVLLFGSYT